MGRRPETPSRGLDVASPEQSVDVPDPSPLYEQSHVIQLLVEIQRQVAALTEKADRIDKDIDKLDEKVDRLRTTFARAQGVAFAAAVLIPLCAGIVWWLVGARMNEMRDQFLVEPPAAHQQAEQAQD